MSLKVYFDDEPFLLTYPHGRLRSKEAASLSEVITGFNFDLRSVQSSIYWRPRFNRVQMHEDPEAPLIKGPCRPFFFTLALVSCSLRSFGVAAADPVLHAQASVVCRGESLLVPQRQMLN